MPITDDTRMRRGWVGSQAANFSGELLPSFGAPVTAANEMKVRTVLAIPRMATTRRSLVLIPDKPDIRTIRDVAEPDPQTAKPERRERARLIGAVVLVAVIGALAFDNRRAVRI